MKWSEIIKNPDNDLCLIYPGVSMIDNGYESHFRRISEELGAYRMYVDKSMHVFSQRPDIADEGVCADIFDLKYNGKPIIFLPHGTQWSTKNDPVNRLADVAEKFYESGANGILFFDIESDVKKWSCGDEKLDFEVFLNMFARVTKKMIYPINEMNMKHVLVLL